jgi:hypothetical protein
MDSLGMACSHFSGLGGVEYSASSVVEDILAGGPCLWYVANPDNGQTDSVPSSIPPPQQTCGGKGKTTNAIENHSTMARLLSADAVLLGRLSSYTIGKELHRAADDGAVYLARSVESLNMVAVKHRLDSIN